MPAPLSLPDQIELMDLLVGGALIMKAELQGLSRGAAYRRRWHERVDELLAKYGRPLSSDPPPALPAGTTPPTDGASSEPATAFTQSHPAGNVLPFVSGRVSTMLEALAGEGFDEYAPDGPRGSM